MQTIESNKAASLDSVNVANIMATFERLAIQGLPEKLEPFIRAWVQEDTVRCGIAGKPIALKISNLKKMDDLFIVDASFDSQTICMYLYTNSLERKRGNYSINETLTYSCPSAEIFSAIHMALSEAETADTYQGLVSHRS